MHKTTMRRHFIIFIIFLMLLIPSAITSKTNEVPSPSDWVKESNIHVYGDRIVIDINDAYWAYYENSNSMDPVLDTDTNGIYIMPDSEDDIQIGDIISFNKTDNEKPVCHRVVDMIETKDGKRFITKGDNNNVRDPGSIGFDKVIGVLVMLVY